MSLTDVPISGLSAEKVIQHQLQNSVHKTAKTVWNDFVTYIDDESKADCGDSIINMIHEVVKSIEVIPGDDFSYSNAFKSSPFAVDLLRFSAVYFYFYRTTHRECEIPIVQRVVNTCIEVLEYDRMEKSFDTLASSLQKLLNCLWRYPSAVNNKDYVFFLTGLVSLVTRLTSTYGNHKKLFVYGTGTFLGPCLSVYAIIGETAGAQPTEPLLSLEKALDSLLNHSLFASEHNLDELITVPLERLAGDTVSHNAGETAGKKRKRGDTRSGAHTSYHAGIYSSIVEWVDRQVPPHGDTSCQAVAEAVARVLRVFIGSSKHAASEAEVSGVTFVQRWRTHIKRTLHFGLGVVLSLNAANPSGTTSTRRYVSLLCRNVALQCMDGGLAGGAEGTGGGIPQHESLTPYVARLRTLGETSIVTSIELLTQNSALLQNLDENLDELELNFRCLSAEVVFLTSLLALDCRSLQDDSLSFVLRIICRISDIAVSRNLLLHPSLCGSVQMLVRDIRILYLGLVNLYGELRRLDTLITITVAAVASTFADEAFTQLISDSDIPFTLAGLFGAMPHGQRNSCWESLTIAATSIHIPANEQYFESDLEKKDQEPKGPCMSDCIFVVSLLLEAIGLSCPAHAPIPCTALSTILDQTIRSLEYSMTLTLNDIQSSKKTGPVLTGAALTAASVLMQIAFNHLSACAFADSIPDYPYEISLHKPISVDEPHVTIEDDIDKQASEVLWTEFCVMAASFVVNENLKPLQHGRQFRGESILAASFGVINGILSTEKYSNEELYRLTESVMRCVLSSFSLFSVVSVTSSPLMKCLNNSNGKSVEVCDETDKVAMEPGLDNETVDCLERAYFASKSDVMNTALDLVTKRVEAWNTSLLIHLPKLTSFLMENLHIWGSLISCAQYGEDESDIECDLSSSSLQQKIHLACKAVAHCVLNSHTSPSIANESLIRILNDPSIDEFSFVPTAVCEEIASEVAEQVRNKEFNILCGWLETLSSLSPAMLCHKWRSIATCCVSVIQFHCEDSTGIDSSTARYAILLLNSVLLHVFSVPIGGEGESELLTDILGCFLCSNSNEYSFVRLVLRCSGDCSYHIHEGIGSIIGHIIRRTVQYIIPGIAYSEVDISDRICKLFCELFTKQSCINQGAYVARDTINTVAIFLLDSLVDCLRSTPQSFVAEQLASDIRLLVGLFKSFVDALADKVVMLPFQAPNSGTVDSGSHIDLSRSGFESCFELLLNIVQSKNEPIDSGADYEVLYILLADLYKLLFFTSDVNSRFNGNDESRPPLDLSATTHNALDSLLLSGYRGSGWTYFVSVWLLLSGKKFHSGGRYLHGDAIKKVMIGLKDSITNDVKLASSRHSLSSLVSTQSVTNQLGQLTSDTVFSSHTSSALHSLLIVTPPQLREPLVVIPTLKSLGVCVGENGPNVLFAIITTLLCVGNSEWRDGSANHAWKNSYKKTIVQYASGLAERLVSNRTGGSEGSSVKGYCAVIVRMSQLLREELLLSQQSPVPHRKGGARSLRTRMSRDTDNTDRQLESALVTYIFGSCVSFLCISSSRILSLLPPADTAVVSENSIHDVIDAVVSLVYMFIDVLSCVTVPVLNSNLGSVVIMFRHLVVLAISLVSHGSRVEGGKGGVDALRLVGRALMASASSKHLQKHAHLIVAGVIDALSGVSTGAQSSIRDSNHVDINNDITQIAVSISSADEILREHLFPGIFALLDKCRTSRQRKQIHAVLGDRARAIYSDLHNVYQQDFKFIGKA